MKAILTVQVRHKSLSSLLKLDAFRRLSLLSLLGLLLILGLLWFFSPTLGGGLLVCPVRHFLGLECPGCGSLRALHSLLHGHVAQAFSYNPLTVLLLPLVLGALITGLIRGREPYHPRQVWYFRAFIALIIIFTIVRNI